MRCTYTPLTLATMQHQQRWLRGREQAGMAGMQPRLLSTKLSIHTLRAKQQALHYRGLTFASSSSLRRRWIWILSLVGTFLMPCNITRQVPALQPTNDWGRLGHELHPSHPLQSAVCFHTWWCHTGSVLSGLGVAPQEGYPTVECIARNGSCAAPHRLHC